MALNAAREVGESDQFRRLLADSRAKRHLPQDELLDQFEEGQRTFRHYSPPHIALARIERRTENLYCGCVSFATGSASKCQLQTPSRASLSFGATR